MNLFTGIPSPITDELIESLVDTAAPGSLRIERIASPPDHASPADFWYDQDTTEWVLLLRGAATLRFEEENETVDLQPGDSLEISPHRRHRIESTSVTEATIWLAVHWN